MNKRHLHHFWRLFRHIKPWYFLLITLVAAGVCIVALRANNEHMVTLRSAVYAADKNDTNVSQALDNLQAYVTGHMNTNLSTGNTSVYPPIQLEYTYQRLVALQADQLQTTNSSLYTDAQIYCQAQDSTDFSGRNRVPCIEQYVTSHGEQPLPAIQSSLYEFDFISPTWSPDLAGFSLAAAIVSGVLAVVLFVADRIIRKRVK